MGVIAFSLGNATGYLYGCMVMSAILAGMLAAWAAVRLRGEDFFVVVDFLLWGLPAGLLLSRLGYVFAHWQSYSGHWQTALCFWQGGLSMYGAAFGFLLMAWGYCSWKGLSLWYWLDILAPALLLGLAVHELGIFATQMTVGAPLPSNLPDDHKLVEYIDYCYRPSGFENYQYFRPVALYQAGMQLVACVLVALLSVFDAHRKQLAAGGIFLLTAAAAAFIRVGCGFWYLSTEPWYMLHFGQWVAVLLGMVCLVIFGLRQRRRRSSWYQRGRW